MSRGLSLLLGWALVCGGCGGSDGSSAAPAGGLAAGDAGSDEVGGTGSVAADDSNSGAVQTGGEVASAAVAETGGASATAGGDAQADDALAGDPTQPAAGGASGMTTVAAGGAAAGDGSGGGSLLPAGDPEPCEDGDSDGYCAAQDNCPNDFNPSQADRDEDGAGDACDSCPDFDEAVPIRFAWPVQGEDAVDWVIRNYLDHDPEVGAIADHTGQTGELARTYDGHDGIDISMPNFRYMDREAMPVFAVAEGTVEATQDGFFDRETTFPEGCARDANFVMLRHDNGLLSLYYHFKRDTVAVYPGQRLPRFAFLGYAGSSGCSSWPHLHFEVRSCDGQRAIDPMVEELFEAPPPYETPIGVMDVILRQGGFESTDAFRDPAPENQTSFVAGSLVAVGLVIGGGSAGDVLTVSLTGPQGAQRGPLSQTFTRPYARSQWSFFWTLTGPSGEWQVHVALNGEEVQSLPFTLLDAL